jgi:hypothetical protein
MGVTQKTAQRVAKWAGQHGIPIEEMLERYNAIEEQVLKDQPGLTGAALEAEVRAELHYSLGDVRSPAVSYTFRRIYGGDLRDKVEPQWKLARALKEKGSQAEILQAITAKVINANYEALDDRPTLFGKVNKGLGINVLPAHDYSKRLRVFATQTVIPKGEKPKIFEADIWLNGNVALTDPTVDGGLYEARFNRKDKDGQLPSLNSAGKDGQVTQIRVQDSVNAEGAAIFGNFPSAETLVDNLGADITIVEIAEILPSIKAGKRFGMVKAKLVYADPNKNSNGTYRVVLTDDSLDFGVTEDGYKFENMTIWSAVPAPEGAGPGSTVHAIGSFTEADHYDSEAKKKIEGVKRPSMNARSIICKPEHRKSGARLVTKGKSVR